MSQSYQYTKHFLESEIKHLSEPLQFSLEIRDLIRRQQTVDGDTEATNERIRTLLFRCNVKIKRYNRNVFSKQATHHIAQQVVKNEHAKMVEVNRRFAQINTVMVPLLVPDFDNLKSVDDKAAEFNALVNELPQSKYLLVSEESNKGEDIDAEVDDSERESLVLDELVLLPEIVSNQDLAERAKQKIENDLQRAQKHIDLPSLLAQYDSVRLQLILLSSELTYKVEKLRYLRKLRAKLTNAFDLPAPQRAQKASHEIYDSDEDATESAGLDGVQLNLINPTTTENLHSEISKFRVLVEKIGLKLNAHGNHRAAKRELQETLHVLNRTE